MTEQEPVTKTVVSSLAGAILQVAREKQAAKKRSSQPPPEGAEPPRAVYLEACRRIGDALSAEGFRFLKSRPQLTRTLGEWKDSVWFQSSRYNVRGAHVSLSTGATMENRRLRQWRVEHESPFGRGARVAGGQMGNLTTPHRWITWNLADPADREAVVADVARTIRDTGLPFFERLKDVRAVADTLLREDIEGLEPRSAIELLLCYLGRDAATAYADAYLARHERFLPDFNAAVARFRASGPPRWVVSKRTEQLALAAVHYGLPLHSLSDMP